MSVLTKTCAALVIALSVCATLPACTLEAGRDQAFGVIRRDSQYTDFPIKAYPIAGGSVVLQGGVMWDPERAPGLIGRSRYPVLYLLEVQNATEEPIWVKAELSFPEGQRVTTPKSTEIAPRHTALFAYGTYGVVVGKKLPWQVTVFADPGSGTLLADLHGALLFDPEKTKRFLDAVAQGFKGIDRGTVELEDLAISGLQEIDSPTAEPPRP